ncbi:glycoside hydrolase family 38 C-terminal domain-containing protein [Bifidobacterium catenulatum]|uniref:glycoside hydrolase family 38 C-terminal domain-containing protein n=1 Tax=Bifidobacterium catenulatum TaxID=1686 RepID=UPI003F8E46B3
MIADSACAVLRCARPDAPVLERARITEYRVDGNAWRAVPAEPVAGMQVSLTHTATGGVILSNGLVETVIEPDGTVSSLKDVQAGRELVPDGMKLGSYELLKDEPSVWDAWEIERDAFLRYETLTSGCIISAETGDDEAYVVVRTKFGQSRIDTTITLRSEAKQLDFAAHVDWHERERFLKVGFPLSVVASIATNGFTGRVNGTMFRLSLLSSPVFPDPKEDIGPHDFQWSVILDASLARTLHAAAELNAPIIGNVPVFDPLVSLETVSGMPIIDWVKLADDGSGDLVIRLYEAAGGHAEAMLHLTEAIGGGLIRETDVMEGDGLPEDLPICLESREPVPAQGAHIHLAPFQLATLRISHY